MYKFKPLLYSLGGIVVLTIVLICVLPNLPTYRDVDIIVHVEVPEITLVLPQMFAMDSTPSIMTSAEDLQDFYATTSVGMIQEYNPTRRSQISIEVSAANAYLYQIAEKYFICYYGMQRVSPILPMAVSNVETPGRANNSITWCALMPTRYVDVSRAMEFDVTNVYDSDTIYKALTTEYSTRDRGCLQMSPTYGTGNSYFNSLMSGTEKDKLAGKTDTWSQGASSSPGDRFYLPDVLLRMSAAMQGQVDAMATNGYLPKTDAELICMMAVGHHSSGVWFMKNHNKQIGCWISADKALEWCDMISSEGFVEVLTSYATSHNATFMDSSTAKRLWAEYSGVTSGFATNDIVMWYPVKVLYAYIKLTLLYTQ